MAEHEEITRREFLTGLGAAAVLVPVALHEPGGTLLEASRRSEGVPRSVRLRRADRTPAGLPRQVTSEVTDAPCWSGDSSRLLYLNNGRMRMVPVHGGPPAPCQ
jgi:hypothetical protein